MIGCLLFLAFDSDKIYKVAFCIGMVGLLIPMIAYKLSGLNKKRDKLLKKNKQIRFNDVFPPKS
jgi:hypothetical protein